jgi:PPP family 3-phenylpropionic acid transporter
MEKKLNKKYSAAQFFYYALFATMFAFVSVFLLDKGFDNSTIGLALSLSSVIAIIAQGGLGDYLDRNPHISIQKVLSIILLIILFGSLLLFAIPVNLMILLLVALTFGLTNALVSPLNSLAFIYEIYGIKINYGFARGMGSLAYALITIILGFFIEATSPGLLPLVYALLAGILIWAIRAYELPEAYQVKSEIRAQTDVIDYDDMSSDISLFGFFKKYRKLSIMMLGMVCLFFAHTFINNFFIQIILPVGGDSGSMGVAIFIGTILELPAMLNFDKLSSKITVANLLKISAVFFLAKHLLTFLAPNVMTIYIAQFLQIGAFSVAYPALVAYINSVVSIKDLNKGQSLLGGSMAVSSMLASLLGGVMLDQIGVSNTLFMGVVTSVLGLVIVMATAEEQEDEPSETFEVT